MNLKGWKYLFTYGLSLDVYANENHRVAVERSSGTVVVRYVICNHTKGRFSGQSSVPRRITIH